MEIECIPLARTLHAEPSLIERLLRFSQILLITGVPLFLTMDGPHFLAPAHTEQALTDLRVIQGAATLFFVHNGRCPASFEELVEDRRLSSSARRVDPWRREFILWCSADLEPQACSSGPDGQHWTTDDVCTAFPEGVWLTEAESPWDLVLPPMDLACVTEVALLLWLVVAVRQRRRVQRAVDRAWPRVWMETRRDDGAFTTDQLARMSFRVRLRGLLWPEARIEARSLSPAPALLGCRLVAWPQRIVASLPASRAEPLTLERTLRAVAALSMASHCFQDALDVVSIPSVQRGAYR